MAYILSGSESDVTAVTGDTFYTALLGTSLGAGLIARYQWALGIVSESAAVTPLNATNFKALSGLRSYSASLRGNTYAIPRIGNHGLVSFATPTFYCTNPRAWSLTLEPLAVMDTTSLVGAVSGPTWRTFRPDSILRWSGTATFGVDSATPIRTGSSGTEPIQAPNITDDTATTDLTDVTLVYGDSASDETFTGECQILGYSSGGAPGQKQEITVSFAGSGPLTATGTNNLFTGGGISTDTVLAPPFVGNGSASAALVARFYQKTSATALYYATADMFWRRITIGCEVGSPNSIAIDFQGSGALTSN